MEKGFQSPNFEARRDGKQPKILLLHYSGMTDFAEVLKKICDPASKVGYHYLIGEDGKTYNLVDESMRAFHAGVSFWQGERDINSISIGISLQNPGHEFGYRPFPQIQIDSLKKLAQQIIKRHSIAPHRVLGHSDVAPDRKTDPGELFPWQELADSGIGVMPKNPAPAALSEREGKDLLTQWGYDPACDMATALIAFQSHYCPKELGKGLNPATSAALKSLISAATHFDKKGSW